MVCAPVGGSFGQEPGLLRSTVLPSDEGEGPRFTPRGVIPPASELLLQFVPSTGLTFAPQVRFISLLPLLDSESLE